ncbi:glycerophosphodiester phosphodiesterase 1-like isoform X2 [Littorina saxatilis]|uniref:glycerophosphodiester phosphodiesterase 1-like isoform X2 n=1 Tax=Littorina saxatilis TaxID=31220 RepID=UPI0038B66C80
MKSSQGHANLFKAKKVIGLPLAAKQGAAGVEIDLQFTADGVGVAFHDDNLDRTTSGNGNLHCKNFIEIQDLDAAAKHSSRTRFPEGSVKIPKLKEMLLECLEHKLLVFIDCKDNCPKTVQLIDTLFTAHPELYNCAVVCSFYPHFIYNIRRKNPEVITALTYRKYALSTELDCVTPRPKYMTGFLSRYLAYFLDYLNMWVTYAWAWRLCGNSFILLNKESVCWNEVQYWKNLGIHILPWTVNSELEKQFFMNHLNLPIVSDGLHSDTSKE